MRVAIVNDVSLAVEALSRVVSGMPGYAIAWIARNGAEAVKKCETDVPDLILMDLVMPVLDGVEATRRIMQRTPCPILVVTATVEGNSGKVVEALGVGALDAVQTPSLGFDQQLINASDLRLKIKTIRELTSEDSSRARRSTLSRGAQSTPQQKPPLIAIGASAGGPSALASIFKELPQHFPAPIIVVQHIDEQFAPSLASWLNEQCALVVRTACQRDEPQVGTILIASSNDHLAFLDGNVVGYVKEPLDCYYRPSVDVFFESIVRHWHEKVIGVLLTGMGRDGAKGLRKLRDANALTITQDAASCVVYGMPKAAVELDAASRVLPLGEIASCLINSTRLEREVLRA